MPNIETKGIEFEKGEFFSEEILIKKIDYYFSNAIARASKTMSDCRQVKSRNGLNVMTG